jgi:branched-chain amino acid transport system ATP-binding protein
VRPLLDVRGLNVYYGEARAVRGVDLRIEEGEIASVVGPNGAGKSTLVNALAGLLRDRTGEIELDGHDLMRPAGHEVCDFGIAIVPEGRRIFSGMSVQDNLELGAYRKAARPERDARVAHVHGLFPILRERSEQRAGTLSGGEQQMLALGRALMSGPKLLLLDEPSLGLAPVVVDTLFDVLQEIHASGVSILLVEQNVTRALAISQNAHLLSDGAIVKSGTAKEFLEDAEVQRICLGV